MFTDFYTLQTMSPRRHPYRNDGSESESDSGSGSVSSGSSGSSGSYSGSEPESEPEPEPERKKKTESKTPKTESKTESKKNKPVDTDVESDGGDNTCVTMAIQFIQTLQKTIEDESPPVFEDTLKKTPVAVNLHYLHFLFYTVRNDHDFTKVLLDYNSKYNIVSKYFLKALRSEEKTKKAMKMLVEVTTEITEKKPLDDIKNLRYFNPEFIVMVTIESGNMEVYEKITSEWELNHKFEKNADLIASFFGIKKFFSDPSRYQDRRELLISAICGGSTKVLARIMRKTESQYMTEYTLRKVRAVCIPDEEMIDFLGRRYDLHFN